MKSPALPSYSKAEKSAFPYLFTLVFLIAFVDSWHRAEVSPVLFLEPEGRDNFWNYARYFFARAVLSLFRSIPEFVWALMFVRAVGLGPFSGVMAIGVAYGGMLGKSFSEIFENLKEKAPGSTP